MNNDQIKPKGTADGVPVYCSHDVIVKTADMKPNPKNPNQHPDEQLRRLGAIIRAAGWRNPITVSTRSGLIVRGHGRLLAAQMAGLNEVPVDYQNYATEADELADLVADNRIAELSDPDMQKLAEVFASIEGTDTSLDLTGYSQDEYAELSAAFSDAVHTESLPEDPDEILPEVQKDAVTRKGDLWICGKHRVYCGDSTNADDVAALMQGEKAAMCFTDPPWNVAIGLSSNPKHRQREGMLNDNMPEAEFEKFVSGFARQLVDNVEGDLYCVLGASEWPTLDKCLRAVGYHWSATIIWAKDTFVLGRSKYHRRYEPIWYGWHNSGKSSFCNRRDLDDVWEVPRPKRSKEHPTMKPVDLVRKAIANSSTVGDLVLDLFGGSGTTMIAVEYEERRAAMLELNPKYVDVIVRRYIQTTGRRDVKCIRNGAELAAAEIADIFKETEE